MAGDETGFNKAELTILAFLADEKGHALWEMRDTLKLDKSQLSRSLKGLRNRGLISREDRDLDRPGKRGPHTEFPYYIKKDRLLTIVKTFLYQIKLYQRESMAAHQTRELLKENDTLMPSLEKKLVLKKLNYLAEADTIIDLFEIPLYRDCLSEIYNINCISYEGIRSILHGGIGLLPDGGQEIRGPEDFFRKHISNIEQSKKIEAERRKLEADLVAINEIKKRWAEGERTHLSRDLGYSVDAVVAQLNQMLAIREISTEQP